MNIYSIVHDAVIAQYEAMALVQDSVPFGDRTVGMQMRAQGRQLAPIYASVAQSATDRAVQAGPMTPSPAGPIPLPAFNFPGPGWANATGLPSPSGLPAFPGMTIPGLPGWPGSSNMPGLPAWPTLPGLPGLPGMPNLPGMPGSPTLPGSPGQNLFSMLAGIAGLDLCAFLKCLVGALPCGCKAGSATTDGGQGSGSDPVRQLLDQALDIFERARQMTDAAASEAEQRVADLKAAAVNASEARRKAMAGSQKLAEEGLREAKRRGEEISTAVGNVIAGFPR